MLTEIMSDDSLLRRPAASNWIEVQCFHLVQLVVAQEDLIIFNPYMTLMSYRRHHRNCLYDCAAYYLHNSTLNFIYDDLPNTPHITKRF
jgi:hypothetical protein